MCNFQKPKSPKFVEVRYDSATKSKLNTQLLKSLFCNKFSQTETILMIYRTRDKKRTEAAINLQAASVIVNYDQEYGVGTFIN